MNSPVQFNDLPDELMELIMKYDLYVFDRRSRALVQKRVSDLLSTHEHSSVPERLYEKVIWLPNTILQFYTYYRELRRLLSSQQLRRIEHFPPIIRIRLMEMQAQDNQDHALSCVVQKFPSLFPDTPVLSSDDTLMANWFRTQLELNPINLDWISVMILTKCGIFSIPDEIIQFRQLQALDVADNYLTFIPDSLDQLTQLQWLYLSNNQLISVPDSLGNLEHLLRLNLHNNHLTSIPDCLGQLQSLMTLNLSHNRLTSVPDTLGNLKNLNCLQLSDNQLTSVPDTLGNLENLMYLDLHRNLLTTVPASLGQLRKLLQLLLSKNQLSFIPDSFGQLTNLRRLKADPLISVPDKLKYLHLRGIHLPHEN